MSHPASAQKIAPSASAKQAVQGDSCRLLYLPAELRIMMYEEVINSSFNTTASPHLTTPALMLTNHQIRSEMLPVYHDAVDCWYSELHKKLVEVGERMQAILARGVRAGGREADKEMHQCNDWSRYWTPVQVLLGKAKLAVREEIWRNMYAA